MLMFHFHLSLLLAMALFAGGLILLHFAASKTGSGFLKLAGIVLVAGSAASAACLAYYGVKYWRQGAYDMAQGGMAHPMPMMMQRMMGKGGMMGDGMMMGPRRDRRMMRPGPGGPPPAMPPRDDMPPPEGATPEEHQQHHPEGSP
jgi:hypothetical protein